MCPIPTQLADAFGLFIQCKDIIDKQALLAQTIHTLQEAVKPEVPMYTSCWNFSTEEYTEVHMMISFSCIHFIYLHFVDINT